MIHKFLICGKQVYLAPKRPQDFAEDAPRSVELRMPIETFWEMKDLIQQADGLIATGIETESITDIYRKILKRAAPYAVSEQDRLWLYASGGA